MLPISKSLQHFLIVGLTFSLLCQPALASLPDEAAPASSDTTRAVQSAIQDIALRDGGLLITRVVDLQGQPVVGELVTVSFQGQVVASSTSDDDGLVAIRGLRAGPHKVETSTTVMACRLWEAETAPPSALTLPAIVADAEVIRGQFGGFNLPQVVVLGTAIAAILIAVDAENDNEDLEDRVRALEAASP